MRQLLYVSNASRDLAPRALDGILSASRANNTLLGITGLLLHIDGGFLQILEGDERAVRELYTRVAADRRHWEPRILLDREIAAPAFNGWSMGFERPCMNDPETAGMFGVTRETIHGRLSPAAGRIVALMLETFYRVQRSDSLGLAQAS
jgi:hypothetical protein